MGAKKQVSETIVTNSFRDLRKIIKRKRAETSSKPVKVKKENLLSDEELFRNIMKEVREIGEFRRIPVYHKTVVQPLKNKTSDNKVLKALEDTVRGRRPLTLSDTQEYVEWIGRDYREEIIVNLHEGKYSVQDCLDLHGMTVEDAEKEVEIFIKNAIKTGHRCIKIIHGRGLRSPNGPVLKDSVIKWLSSRFRKYIVAFVTARQCDGGLGALYILLK